MKNWNEELFLSCKFGDEKRYSEFLRWCNRDKIRVNYVRDCLSEAIKNNSKVFYKMVVDFKDVINLNYDYFRGAIYNKNFDMCVYMIENGFKYEELLASNHVDLRFALELKRYIKMKQL